MSVAAVIGARINHVLRAFDQAGAYSPQTARSPEGLGLNPRLTHKRALLVLFRRGVLVEARSGLYFIDREAVDRMRTSQIAILCGSLIFICLLFFLPLIFG